MISISVISSKFSLRGSSVGSASDWYMFADGRGAGSIITSGNSFSWRFGHEIISTAILSLPLIQVR